MVKEKQKSVDKYKSTMQSLQCTNGLIVLYIMNHLRDLAHLDNGSIHEKQEEMKWYVTYLARMLSITYIAQWTTHKWLFILYFRLKAAVNTETYSPEEINNLLYDLCDDKDIFNEIVIFIENCKLFKYLPKQDQSRNYDVISNMIQIYANYKFDFSYQYSEIFTDSNLAVPKMLNNDQHFLFDFLPHTQLLNKTFDMLNLTVNKLKDVVFTINWSLRPFDYIDYHVLFMRIAYTKLLYHTWFHTKTLHQYVKTIKLKYQSKTTKNMLETFWFLLYKPLENALIVLDIEDNFFCTLYHEMLHVNLIDKNHIDTIVELVTTLLIENFSILKIPKEILNDVSFPKLNHEIIKNIDLVKSNTNKLDEFIQTIQEITKPIDIKFIKIFCKAKYPQLIPIYSRQFL
ncbi:uncharacterized protein LOC126899469 isoform X2 [Daktulosphaira vitifoliae]|nr:uncharacterized protein LOC126899469 isoform X2 [Daktulosphaira vitifoliae]XP_050530387.1 uncharacterized protein LOC126899469 isoform X2 [Daktulosphaira vitifoliae]